MLPFINDTATADGYQSDSSKKSLSDKINEYAYKLARNLYNVLS